MADQKMKCVFFKGVCVFPADEKLECQSATLFQEVDFSIKTSSSHNSKLFRFFIFWHLLFVNY